MTDKIQKKIYDDFACAELFEQAKRYALAYAEDLFARRIFPAPHDVDRLQALVGPLPDLGANASDILQQLHELGSPATVACTASRYYGLVTGGAMPVTIATGWLTKFWDQNGALYKMSPVTSVMEQLVETWLGDLLGLPNDTVAGFVSGSSIAILSGLAAARYRIYAKQGWDVNKRGLAGAPKMRVVTSVHCHATVMKAIALLGIGTDNVELVAVDAQGRIRCDQLPPLDGATMLILQAGNVNSGAFDAFDQLCDAARNAGSWVHIDGAFGLWAAASPALSPLCQGIDKADSWSLDGHKTLNTPYDSGIILCRDAEALEMAMQASGSYITFSTERDGMRYTPEMSRRARAIELWAAMAYLGRDGIAELVYGLHLRARQFGEELEAEGFEIVNDIVFNQVLVRHQQPELHDDIIAHIEKSGICWVGGAQWFGKPVIRVSVCSWATRADDVTRSVAAFVAAREAVLATRRAVSPRSAGRAANRYSA